MLKRFSNCRAILAALAATAALGVSAAHATTYYVSSSGGNDGNNGTSTSTPWQTTAKVNGFALNPGDQVLFKRGDNWYSSITCTRSGAQGNPITFADYGTGNKPTFWGSNPLPNSGFTSIGGNEYTTTWTGAAPEGVLINHYQGVANTWLVPGNPATPGFFSYSGTTLTIYSATNPATDGKAYTVDTREDVLYSNGQSHLVFTNLIAEEATDPGEGYVIRVMNSADVVLNSCEAYYGSKHIFGFINSTGVIANNCVAQWGLPFNNSNGCTFYVSFADYTGPFQNCTSVYNNCSGSNFTDGQGGAYQYFVCHGSQQGPMVFNNPTDLGGKFSVLQDGNDPLETMTINGGLINNASLELFSSGGVFNGVTFTGNSGVDNYGANNLFENCLMNLLLTGGGQTGYWSAVTLRNGASGNIFKFNTFAMNPGNSSGNACIVMLGPNSHTQAYGNIFASTGLDINTNGVPSSNDITSTDYNIYNPGGYFNGGLTLAQWRADTGADAHSTQVNPLFTNQAGNDFSLQATSPAVDFVPLSFSYPPYDIVGTARPDGSANDAGAYQKGSHGNNGFVPTITSSLTAGGVQSSAFSYQIVAAGSPTSYYASSLPAGLSINTGTGVISGTPTGATQTNVTLTATNSSGSGHATLALTIASNLPAITSPLTAGGVVGSVFSYTITATNSPTSYNATGLPGGLSVNTSTGVISGSPASTGTTNVTISATNFNGTTSATLVITVSTGTPFTINAIYTTGTAFSTGGLDSFGDSYVASELGSSVAFNGSTITFGAPNVVDGWSSQTVALPSGTYTALNMVGTAAGGIGSSQTFTVNYTDGTQSTHTINMSDWTSPGGLTGESKIVTMAHGINSSGALYTQNHYLAGWTLTLTGHSVQSITLPTQRGVVILGFGVGSGTPPAPVINSALTKSGTVGVAFSYTITATNTPTSYGATPLPAGLSVNTGTGVISGTPSATGSTNTTISATNAGGTGTATLVITIGSAGSPPVINSALTKSGTVGTALSYNITATNSPTSYNATPLPAGLSVNTGTGAITGTPTTQGISNTTISATNASGTGSATLVFTISSPATAYNIFAYFTLGTAVTNGGADSFSSAYESNLMPSSTTFNGSTFTYAAANVADAWSNVTVNLPPGNYTTLNMLASSTGGNVTSKTFTVNYTDGTNSVFTQSLHDWTSSSVYAGETTVVTMANRLNSSGQVTTPAVYFKGYTFTLNGKSVQSITLPASRQVVAFGFAGR